MHSSRERVECAKWYEWMNEWWTAKESQNEMNRRENWCREDGIANQM